MASGRRRDAARMRASVSRSALLLAAFACCARARALARDRGRPCRVALCERLFIKSASHAPPGPPGDADERRLSAAERAGLGRRRRRGFSGSAADVDRLRRSCCGARCSAAARSAAARPVDACCCCFASASLRCWRLRAARRRRVDGVRGRRGGARARVDHLAEAERARTSACAQRARCRSTARCAFAASDGDASNSACSGGRVRVVARA